MNTEDLVLLLTELPYDRQKLLKIFEQTVPYFRVKGLPWKENKDPVSIKTSKCLVVQYGEHMMLEENKKHLSCNLLDFDYIKELVGHFNFSHDISAGNLDLLWYKKGFHFDPHVDHYAASTMMFPIYPSNGGAPLDFYHKEGLEYTRGQAKQFNDLVGNDDIVYTHYYSTEYPTVFNSHRIHGIRPVTENRIYFRVRINEPFESIVSKYKKGELLK